jgi:hypothetical protein
LGVVRERTIPLASTVRGAALGRTGHGPVPGTRRLRPKKEKEKEKAKV